MVNVECSCEPAVQMLPGDQAKGSAPTLSLVAVGMVEGRQERGEGKVISKIFPRKEANVIVSPAKEPTKMPYFIRDSRDKE